MTFYDADTEHFRTFYKVYSCVQAVHEDCQNGHFLVAYASEPVMR